VTGAWWPLRNAVRHGDPFPSIGGNRMKPPGFEPDPISYVQTFTPSITHRFWGNFGWFDAPLPQLVVVVATGAAIVAAVSAFRRRRTVEGQAAPGPPRSALVVFAASFPMLFALVLSRAYSAYASSGRTPLMQGRYLFAAMVPFAVVVGLGAARLIGRRAPLLLLGSAGLMQAEGVRAALTSWWAEPDASLRRSLSAMVRWSPWPTVAVVVVGLGVVLVGGFAAVRLLAIARHGTPDPGGTTEAAPPDESSPAITAPPRRGLRAAGGGA
jgi:hypothetical protein